MGTIKDKYMVAAKPSLTYVKPYTTRIDSLKIPVGYQPPKFQQFHENEVTCGAFRRNMKQC